MGLKNAKKRFSTTKSVDLAYLFVLFGLVDQKINNFEDMQFLYDSYFNLIDVKLNSAFDGIIYFMRFDRHHVENVKNMTKCDISLTHTFLVL